MPSWIWVGALLLLLGFSALVWTQRRTQRPLVFGWLWFLGTLVPVIGIVQVGAQAMADRYMYVPMLGVLTAAAWIVGDRVQSSPRRQKLAISAAGLALAACFFLTQRQVTAWTNSVQLYERSLAAGEDNASIRYLYGVALQAAGRPEADVIAQYRLAIEREPDYINAHTQLAIIALRRQNFDEARLILERTIRFEPDNAALYSNLGSYWTLRDDFAQALPWFEKALKLTQRSAGLHRELGSLYQKINRPADARRHYELAIKYDGWTVADYTALGLLIGNRGEYAESRRLFARALWLEPGNKVCLANLAALERLERAK